MNGEISAELAEHLFFTVADELSLVKCRLRNMIHVMYNRFGSSHKFYQQVWSLHAQVQYSLSSALDSVICSYYPRNIHEIRGVWITNVYYRSTELEDPFSSAPKEPRTRRSKQLREEESKYLNETIILLEEALKHIIVNKQLFNGRCESECKKTQKRIDKIKLA